jgi:hypothetical protein
MPRRFPPPWSIEEHTESFIVKDANGQQLAYVYFEDEPQRRMLGIIYLLKRCHSYVT